MELTSEMSTVEQYLFDQAVKSRTPINGSIELLPLCNMNCDMCYVRLSRKEMEAQGRLRSVDEWLEIGRQMKEAGTLFLLLTGGEPLLYPGFKDLFCKLKRMGLILTVNSNGTLLDEEWTDFFKEQKPRRINITLYGSCNETYENLCHYPGGFDRVMRAVQLLKGRGIDVNFGCSVTKKNQKEVEEIMKIANDIQIPIAVDPYMMPATRERNMEYKYQVRLLPEDGGRFQVKAKQNAYSKERFEQFRKKKLWEIENILPSEGPNRMSCMAGKCSFTINWQGEMRPCVIMTEPAISVFEHGFQKSWEYIKEETDKIILCSKCSSCKLRTICRTCAACALFEEGSYDAVPRYMCRYAEAIYRELLAGEDANNAK